MTLKYRLRIQNRLWLRKLLAFAHQLKLRGTLCLLLTSLHLVSYAEETVSIPEIRMGFYYPAVYQIASRTEIILSLNIWAKEISNGIGVRVADVQLFDDVHVMAKAFAKQEINFAVASPLTFALHFDRKTLAECFYGSRADNAQDAVLLIAQAKDNINSILDLQHKRLIMPENDELAAVFLNTLTLEASGKKAPQFFSEILLGAKTNRAILDVFFNKADAAIAMQASYEVMNTLNPQLKEQLKIIDSYPIKSKAYSFLHKDFEGRKLVADSYLGLVKTARGRQLLEVYQQQSVQECSTQDLVAFDQLNAKFLALSQHKPVVRSKH